MYNYFTNTNQKGSFFKIVASASMLLVIFLIYSITNNIVFFALGIAILAFYLIFLDLNTFFLIACILAPNLMMIKLSSSAAAIFGYFLLLYAIKRFIKGKNMKIPIILLFHILAVMVTVALYSDRTLLLSLIRFSFFVLLIDSMFFNTEEKSNSFREDILKSYIIGVFLCVILGLIYYYSLNKDIFDGMFSGINNDRNYFSASIATGVSVILLRMISIKRVSFASILILFTLLVGGVLSASRAFLISVSACSLFVLMIMLGKARDKWLIPKFILISVLAVLVFGKYISPAVRYLLERFTLEDVSGGNGRYDAWKYYLNMTISSFSRFLFGNGASNYYVDKGLIKVVEHNTFIQAFSTVGLVGFTTWFLLLIRIYKVFVSNLKKVKLYYLLPLIVSMVVYSGVNALYSDQFSFSLVISLVAIVYAGKNNENANIAIEGNTKKLNLKMTGDNRYVEKNQTYS